VGVPVPLAAWTALVLLVALPLARWGPQEDQESVVFPQQENVALAVAVAV
jgi:hypothetical protein